MLGKSPGCIDVSKLCAILLLEVDFNIINKTVFNSRVIPFLELISSLSYKIIGSIQANI